MRQTKDLTERLTGTRNALCRGRVVLVTATLLGMFGCATPEEPPPPQHSEFFTALKFGYLELAERAASKSDPVGATTFFEKSKAAAAQRPISPQPVDDTAKATNGRGQSVPLSTARQRLVGMLDDEVLMAYPLIVADALLSFDCWAYDQKRDDVFANCQEKHRSIMARLEDMVGDTARREPATTATTVATPTPVAEISMTEPPVAEVSVAEPPVAEVSMAEPPVAETSPSPVTVPAKPAADQPSPALARISDQAQTPAPPARSTQEASAAQLGSYIIIFPANQAALSNLASTTLDHLGQSYVTGPVLVTGHVASSLTVNEPPELALQRAKEVERYLLHLGIPVHAITVRSAADTQPLIVGTTEGSQIINRRVEVSFPDRATRR